MSNTIPYGVPVAGLRPRKVTDPDVSVVIETLALAFHDDPVVSWCMPEGGRRREILPRFFAAVADSYLRFGEIYDVPEGVSAAVWAPPGAQDDEQLLERIGQVSEEYAEPVFQVLGLLAQAHPIDPHY